MSETPPPQGRPPEERRLRRGAAVAAVLLLVLLAAAIFGPERFRPASGSEDPALGLLIVWYVDLTLTAAISFVLLRSLVKLWFERRSRTPGSRFRVRLVAILMSLALLPTALVFVVASDLLGRSIDRWFSPGFAQALGDARFLAERLAERERDRTLATAGALGSRVRSLCLAEPAASFELDGLLATEGASAQLDLVALWARGGTRSLWVSEELSSEQLPSFPEELLRQAATGSQPVSQILVVPGGRLILAAAPAGGSEDEAVLLTGILLGGELDRAALGAIRAHQGYQIREEQRGDVKAASILLFLSLTLLVLLAAVWIGLYVGRRLVTPIQALVESTRKVSAGDLSARVDVPADDEIRGLVDNWNDMIDQLRLNKELLVRSNEDLRTANLTLENGRRFVRAILESATTAILALDSGDQIQVANRSAAALLGEPEGPKRMIGRRLQEFSSSPAGGALVDLVAAVRERTLAEPVREFNLEREGETRTYEARLAPLQGGLVEEGGVAGEAGVPGGWVLAVEDVTPVVHAQRSAAWQEVARRMAHEVRNPLTPIKLSAERMSRKLASGGEDLPGAIREGTATIIEHVVTLENLVDEFSRFARMPRFDPKPTDVEPLIRRAVDLYSEVRPGVSVGCGSVAVGGEVRVDPDGLRRVLVNLLENALDATPDGGRVEVSANRVAGNLRLEVVDDGRGIAPADRARIFQPYFSTKGRGTGLGLALVRRIVTDHGGTIRVEANEPKGSRFVVELPI
jgi:two-component system nitrogen regulation sensor histidine kinase NtrY